MMLDVKQVSKLLAVSEKTVYRWIANKKIPTFKIGEGYRFNRVELLEWATANRIPVSPAIFDNTVDVVDTMPSLVEALEAGGVHYRVSGSDKESVIREIVKILPLPEDADRLLLTNALMARENMGSTAIGNGIAIPHVRNPIIFHVNRAMLAVCFLEYPVEFGALDNKPVNTLLTIITNTVRSHLHILSRLSFALHKESTRKVINSTSSRAQILEALASVEAALAKEES
jgi:PTS system nitrogen regulatory IIA component